LDDVNKIGLDAQMIVAVMAIVIMTIFVPAGMDGDIPGQIVQKVVFEYLTLATTIIANYKQILGLCPYDTAWGDKAFEIDTAHSLAECSNQGICNFKTVYFILWFTSH